MATTRSTTLPRQTSADALARATSATGALVTWSPDSSAAEYVISASSDGGATFSPVGNAGGDQSSTLLTDLPALGCGGYCRSCEPAYTFEVTAFTPQGAEDEVGASAPVVMGTSNPGVYTVNVGQDYWSADQGSDTPDYCSAFTVPNVLANSPEEAVLEAFSDPASGFDSVSGSFKFNSDYWTNTAEGNYDSSASGSSEIGPALAFDQNIDPGDNPAEFTFNSAYLPVSVSLNPALNVATRATSGTGELVTWTYDNTGSLSHSVLESTNGGAFQEVGSANPGDSGMLLTGLNPGDSDTFEVIAYNADGTPHAMGFSSAVYIAGGNASDSGVYSVAITGSWTRDKGIATLYPSSDFGVTSATVVAGSKEEAVLMAIGGSINSDAASGRVTLLSGAFEYNDDYWTNTADGHYQSGATGSAEIGQALALAENYQSGDDFSGFNYNSDYLKLSVNRAADFSASVSVGDALAIRDTATPASFIITRTGDISNSATVYFTMGGDAVEGTDYDALAVDGNGNHYVTFAANAATATVTITPIATSSTADQSIILTLETTPGGGGSYAIGDSDPSDVGSGLIGAVDLATQPAGTQAGVTSKATQPAEGITLPSTIDWTSGYKFTAPLTLKSGHDYVQIVTSKVTVNNGINGIIDYPPKTVLDFIHQPAGPNALGTSTDTQAARRSDVNQGVAATVSYERHVEIQLIEVNNVKGNPTNHLRILNTQPGKQIVADTLPNSKDPIDPKDPAQADAILTATSYIYQYTFKGTKNTDGTWTEELIIQDRQNNVLLDKTNPTPVTFGP